MHSELFDALKVCTIRRDQVNLLVHGPDRPYLWLKQKK